MVYNEDKSVKFFIDSDAKGTSLSLWCCQLNSCYVWCNAEQVLLFSCFKGTLPFAGYAELRQKVCDEGFLGLKAYFWAERTGEPDGGEFCLLAPPVPTDTWFSHIEPGSGSRVCAVFLRHWPGLPLDPCT